MLQNVIHFPLLHKAAHRVEKDVKKCRTQKRRLSAYD